MNDINKGMLEDLRKQAINGTKAFIRLKDARIKRFFWQVTKKGVVAGIIRYSVDDVEKVYVVAELGSGVNQFTVTAVLAKARRVASEIKNGGDPQAQHKADKAERALSKAKSQDPLADDDVYVEVKANEYYRQHKALPSTKKSVRTALDQIVEAFGYKRVKDVTQQDVVGLLIKLQERGAVGKYSVAENCQKFGRAMWNWGLDRGGFGDVHNYFAVLKSFRKEYSEAAKKGKYVKRMTLDDVREMAEVYLPQFPKGIQRTIILQAYTAVRPANVTSAPPLEAGGRRFPIDWSEFNLDKGEWHISQNRMKGREREHIIRMPPQLIAHLRAWHKEDGYPEAGLVVRGARRPYKELDSSDLGAAYRTKKLSYTPHKWRHLISNYIAERGGKEIADLILAHYTTDTYIETTREDDREKWLQVWADKLDTLGFDKLLATG